VLHNAHVLATLLRNREGLLIFTPPSLELIKPVLSVHARKAEVFHQRRDTGLVVQLCHGPKRYPTMPGAFDVDLDRSEGRRDSSDSIITEMSAASHRHILNASRFSADDEGVLNRSHGFRSVTCLRAVWSEDSIILSRRRWRRRVIPDSKAAR